MTVKRVCDLCGQEFERGAEYFEIMVDAPDFQMQDFHDECRSVGVDVPKMLDDGAQRITIARKKWY